MIKTCGLTHLHLIVKDLQRSLVFYKSVFGMEVKFWAGDGLVFLNFRPRRDISHIGTDEFVAARKA